MSKLFREVPINAVGRDFIVGDIHGCFTKLKAHLDTIGFNPDACDRLFSVGDLVDRGDENDAALEWLAQPWFFAVAGNHEDMAIRWANGEFPSEHYIANGGAWNVVNSLDRSLVFAGEFMQLPIAIELETSKGRVGIVHADCPFHSWETFKEELSDAQGGEEFIRDALWSRYRIRAAKFGINTSNVTGIRAVVVGHTPMDSPTWVNNIFHIDTGGWHPQGSGFTVVDAATLEVVN
jgi:serine/threonine protein phosphatase 1